MSSFSSIGDLSRSFQLRLANASMKQRLDTLTNEVSSGKKTDVSRYLSGDLSRINHLETRIKQIDTYLNNVAEAGSRFGGMQASLEKIQSITSSTGPALLSDATTGSRESLLIRLREGGENLTALINTLNTQIGNNFLFSGTRSDTAALSSALDITALVSNEILGYNSVGDITSTIETWFDRPHGTGGFLDSSYHGSVSDARETPVSESQSVRSDVTANSEPIREILKAFTTMFLAAENSENFSTEELRGLAQAAGQWITNGNIGVTSLRANIGVSEHLVSRAAIQNNAQKSTLQISRSSIESADPYETAVALKEVESGIQNLYALTVRISNLKLTDYL